MTPRSNETEPMEEQQVDNGRSSRRSNNSSSNNKRSSPSQETEKRSKRTRRGVFDESGMTDQERRELRRNQRQLNETIRQDKREALPAAATANDSENENDDATDADAAAKKVDANANMEFLKSARQHNNELFESVRFTREAVLDAENVDLIAQKYVQQVEQLVQVPRYDPVKLVHKLVQKCTVQTSESACFDWRTLGSECGICFNALPLRVSFLAGPLDAVLASDNQAKKPRVVRQRAVAEQGEEVKPEQVQADKNTKQDVDQLSAVEQTMKLMKKKLKDRCRQEYTKNKERAAGDAAAEKLVQETGMEIDGVQYLFNPKSFTQTVENIFHFSFLIKKGEAAIGVRASPQGQAFEETTDQSLGRAGLFLKPAPRKEHAESRQAVVAFTMKDWRALCQGYDLKEGDLPHRTGSKHSVAAVAASRQQSQESASL